MDVRIVLVSMTNRPINVSSLEHEMTPPLSIHILTGSDDAFCTMLNEAGVIFSRRLPAHGVVMNAGDTIQVVQDIASNAAWPAAIATVLIAWIRSRATRKATFTTKDNEVVHAFEGMSPEEIERLVKLSRSISIIDTTPKAKNKKG